MGLEFAALSLSKCLSNVLTKHNNQHVCVSTVCVNHIETLRKAARPW